MRPFHRLLLAAWFAASAFPAGAASGAAPQAPASLNPLLELIDLVEKHYATDSPVTERDLLDRSLSGMVADLDRYSEFLDQQKFKDLQEDTRGSFGGIGIEIGIQAGKLSVIAPIEGTPAEKAGLLGGDYIAYIDGVPTDDMKLMDAVHRIKGPPGTKVMLTVLREGYPAKDYTMVRAVITPVNIRSRVLDDTGYVAIKSFSERTSEDLAAALEGFRAKGLRGVILDLRSNPGGLLEEAVRVVDLFLPEGRLIVSTEGRDPSQRTKRFSMRKRFVMDMPMVVLINEHSASASEIVAGALKDWGRAVLAGRRSFGKASVQAIQPVSRDRSQAVRLTVARYYTSLHREIHEVGIEPDVRLPPLTSSRTVRRLLDDGVFVRMAQDLPASGTGWLDQSALKEGLLLPGLKAQSKERFGERLNDEVRRWLENREGGVTPEEWPDMAEESVVQLRLAVMRKAKGEEAARRFAVEFDPQVMQAGALLKLAAGPSGKN